MPTDPPGSIEIRLLADALRIHAAELRSRNEIELANSFDETATSLVFGPAGEIPLRKFASNIYHWKGYIDSRPASFSKSEWSAIIQSLRIATKSALRANGWSQTIFCSIKRALWPFRASH
jgi:hypothetical protein